MQVASADFPKYPVCLYKPGDPNDEGLFGISLDVNNTPYFDGWLEVEHVNSQKGNGIGDHQTGEFSDYVIYSGLKDRLCEDCTEANPNVAQVGDLVEIKSFGSRKINGTITNIISYGDCNIECCNCEIYFQSKYI